MMKYIKWIALSLMFTLLNTGQAQQLVKNIQQREDINHSVYAIHNVNIIPLTKENKILVKATVLIAKNKIVSINESIPDSAIIINGNGKWLIPGLIDMHVHVLADVNLGASYPTKGANIFFNTQDVMTPFITNGVTTVFNLNSTVENFGQRNEIERGSIIGPRMALAALINGGDSDKRTVNTPADGRQAVRSAKAEGYDFIKVYSQLNIETFKAIVDEANIQGLKVIGHIPDAFKGRLIEAFVPNFSMVAHAEEFAKQSTNYTDEDARRFAEISKKNGTWLTPTLTVMVWIASQTRSLDKLRSSETFQYVHPLMQSKWLTANHYNKNSSPEFISYVDNLVTFHKKLVKAFKEAGVPIVTGTDAGNTGVVSGFSLHDELDLLVEAGLTPEEALVSATRLPATWLGIVDKIGTVEVGKFADLVLLEDNPLENIKNTRKIAGVFANGRWLTKATIDSMLLDLSRRNTRDLDKYDWGKMKGKLE